jgi:hypothetical protein
MVSYGVLYQFIVFHTNWSVYVKPPDTEPYGVARGGGRVLPGLALGR